MASKNGKPTNKQRDNAIGELIAKVNEIAKGLTNAYEIIRQLDVIVGMYVNMNGDKEKFDKYILEKQEELKKEQEENDAKKDGEADKPNLQGDTDGESSGSEGVREEGK
mgnify:CR=1 FL=1|tara:strand:- start:1471 stop:1797 length:327 start_codon:yes stop_codon:yes gene_type:complete